MIKKFLSLFLFLFIGLTGNSQNNPAITHWLQNQTATGSYYMEGNPTALGNGILVNCQQVAYNDDYVYVATTGVPAYPTGPFLDGNPSIAENQQTIFRIPLNPDANTGTPDPTTMGSIGIFINGVSLFDYRDGVGWNQNTQSLCGGPGYPPCQGPVNWTRDAIPAEREGFDCAKGHPAMGRYHHHQNPSAFKLDLELLSTICNIYDADGLYTIDSSKHSPLIGFAYDGFPIYGAYGFKNADGSGGITRIKSSYQLKNITSRPNGPAIDQVVQINSPFGMQKDTLFLGYFREDYEYIPHTDEDYLDEHNGRFCKTPEYPDGTYAYFCTIDENWNSAFPYAVGPTFYGNYQNGEVNSIPTGTTLYTGTVSNKDLSAAGLEVAVFPNPASEFIGVQIQGLLTDPLLMELISLSGKVLLEKEIHAGQTLSFLEIESIYNGHYFLILKNSANQKSVPVVISR